ncbi:MAG TPA: superoxide dismutase family protein [Terrimicrobiaceae bacterium]
MKTKPNLAGMLVALTFVTLPLWPSHAKEKAVDEAMDSAPVIVDATELIAILSPTEGNQAAGVVTFKSAGKGKVEVKGDLRGLSPNSKHAIHIHQYGDLTSKDGKSAGDHYNPLGHQHALPDHKTRHAGDFGNLDADASGNATLRLVVDNISLAGRLSPIIGRCVVVHAKPDDGGQPSGNAGDRIAVGVIGVKNPKD